MPTLSCFKAYDIRGKIGEEINENIAYRIGRAFSEQNRPKIVVVGCDVRLTSQAFKQAVADGLRDAGTDVIDIGLCGTEEIYFAAFHLDVDGGIEITASHNPLDYNGMKLVGRGARPISRDTGLAAIQQLAEANAFPPVRVRGGLVRRELLPPYVDHLLGYVDPAAMRPLRLVVNAGNGVAGHVVDALEARFIAEHVPITFLKMHFEPDGTFPHGIPNPLLPENRQETADAVRRSGADMGIAWDGDFDRCFFFDASGRFIEGYYIVGLLAEAFLRKHPGGKIIHDPRLVWNTIEMVRQAGGIPVQSKTGHAFIKERMRQEDAVYGGEMSAHHYFREFGYCDSGMLPWLLLAELISLSGRSLADLVGERMAAYPCSGEINYTVADTGAAIERVFDHLALQASGEDHTDGLSLEFDAWRFNLRASNTEPLLRLNVEARGDASLVDRQVQLLSRLIRGEG